MECQYAQEAILDTFDTRGAALPPDVDAHVSGCGACARFALQQRTLDTRLAAQLISPPLGESFRSDLRRSAGRDTPSPWFDRLPEIVHFWSCGVATVCCAFVLPFAPATTLGAGTMAALLTYTLLATVRSSFEDLELPQR
jgi:hypothetical protein